jgi:toxin-antitoxin system PIN domain toxin
VTRYLLDVNVLIALIDPSHIWHDAAHLWFATTGQAAWATCPITENGVVRIVGHSRYPNSPGSPAAIAHVVSELCRLAGHEFWPDDISLFDGRRFDVARLLASGLVTDSYLLALAIAHGGMLATFDRRLVTNAVAGGDRGLRVIAS